MPARSCGDGALRVATAAPGCPPSAARPHKITCHPERRRTIREANRSAEAKDPYPIPAVRPHKRVPTVKAAPS